MLEVVCWEEEAAANVAQRQTPRVVFVDVDGVLSIEDPVQIDLRREQWPGCGPAWPIPIANALLRVLDQDPRVRPVWMTHWERRAWLWNDRAGTQHWPVAFPLAPARLQTARQLIATTAGGVEDTSSVDEKLLAACYYLRRNPERRVIWMEDGFAPETVAWADATRGQVRLVDTTEEAVRALLVAADADAGARAQAFLDDCLK